jgi:hypothetical protein
MLLRSGLCSTALCTSLAARKYQDLPNSLLHAKYQQ